MKSARTALREIFVQNAVSALTVRAPTTSALSVDFAPTAAPFANAAGDAKTARISVPGAMKNARTAVTNSVPPAISAVTVQKTYSVKTVRCAESVPTFALIADSSVTAAPNIGARTA